MVVNEWIFFFLFFFYFFLTTVWAYWGNMNIPSGWPTGNEITVLNSRWMTDRVSDRSLDVWSQTNMQVSATVTVIGHFFSLSLFNSSRFFCLHPVVIRERADVQHTRIHMIHTLTGRRAQTLEYISVTKKWLLQNKTKQKKREWGDYKSTTRVEADSESDSSLSDSFLDVPQDFSLEYVLSHTEKIIII